MSFNIAMKTLLYANRAEHKSISVISILLLAAVGDITKLRCMHRECYIFANMLNHNTLFLGRSGYLRGLFMRHQMILYHIGVNIYYPVQSNTIQSNRNVTYVIVITKCYITFFINKYKLVKLNHI